MRDQREHKCERGWKELELGPFGLEVGLQKEPRSHLCELQMGPNLELGPFGLKVGLQKEPRSYLCEHKLALIWSWAHLDLKWALTSALLYKVDRIVGLEI